MRDVEELMREAMHEQTPHLTLPHDAAARALRTGQRRRLVERAGVVLVVVAAVVSVVGLAHLPRRNQVLTTHTVGTTVTLTPGGSATPQQLTSAADIVRARLAAQGITALTSVSGGVVSVSVPTSGLTAVDAAAMPGVLTFREIYSRPSGTTYSSRVPSTPVSGGPAAAATVTGLNPPAGERDQTAPTPATLAQFAATDCSEGGRPTTVDEDPHHFVVACDRSGQTKYLLTPADLLGTQVATATASQIQSSGSGAVWVIDVTFRASAAHQVAAVSTRLLYHADQPLAITVDGEVIDAPSTNAVFDQNIEISGGETQPFTQRTAVQLAATFDAGALPVAFTVGAAGT